MPLRAPFARLARQVRNKFALPSGPVLLGLSSLGTSARRFVRQARDSVTLRRALRHRATLEDTVFIGITGSAGKTMTKFLVGAVLSSRLTGRFARGTLNNLNGVARNLLKYASRGDNFHVVELSAGVPGVIAQQLSLVRPSIGIVTAIGTDHYSAYGSVEALATEKSKLVEALPETGIAILNADDTLVMAMRATCKARVMTYGVHAEAMVRAVEASSAWPRRLSVQVSYQDQTAVCETQLLGTQWVPAVLAAIATGLAMGISLDQATRAVGIVAPNDGRMSPVELPDGVTWIRDDWKASLYTLAPSIEFLRAAAATRKIAVIGTISDTYGSAARSYIRAATLALDVADLVCFVGPQAFLAMNAQPKDAPHRLVAFGTARAAHDFLRTQLRSGDLVLLKASAKGHLQRLVLAHSQEVSCWKTACRRGTQCSVCPELRRSNGPTTERPDPAAVPGEAHVAKSAALSPEDRPTFVIGFGNPGEHRRDSPHNVGQRVVDHLATRFQAEWTDGDGAVMAKMQPFGRPVWLLKPKSPVNLTGRCLHAMSDHLGFLPEDCVLVQDDLDLPLGSVRVRMKGSDGGHRGVRSVLEAFQSLEFRRVKIGVQREGDSRAARDVVLAPFDRAENARIEAAVGIATSKLEELLEKGTVS
jgi:aminoacyl-tRNA hydrolase